ncbi:MAG: hypothetical protein H6739_34665 [Alphaproteobacteria bacterium]|nr:hypothetical protein [Alphaproteobacteria bacterium]
MNITLKLAFDERAAVRLLNHLARENAFILRAQPELPLLYDAGVVYRREPDETWPDVLHLLAQGWEDCDGLAAARAGELLARGARALSSDEPGYAEARRLRLDTIQAEVLLRTRTERGKPGLYHCVTRYRVAGRWHRDDPSARLGMHGTIDPSVLRRWKRQGRTPSGRTA